jgi:hypothetical protein
LVRFAPELKLRLDGVYNGLQLVKVSIVQRQASGQFPDPLDGVKVWAVRRQVGQTEVWFMLGSPLLMDSGVMVTRVIRYYDDLLARGATGLFERAEESGEGFPVELGRLPIIHELTVAQADGAVVANAVANRRVQQNGVLCFRRDPHAASRSVLLEMHFVKRPEFDGRITGQVPEFF